MEELYKSIMNSNNEVVEIYLPGFKALTKNFSLLTMKMDMPLFGGMTKMVIDIV